LKQYAVVVDGRRPDWSQVASRRLLVEIGAVCRSRKLLFEFGVVA